MGIKERQERQREEMRNLILQGAGEIIAEEGLNNLSIRKIAQRIEYSPAVIYHYFANKEHILQSLIMERYKQLMERFKSAESGGTDPKAVLKRFIVTYADWAVSQKEVYIALMVNDMPGILEYTGVLRRGITRENRPAIKILVQAVRDLSGDPELSEEEVELRVQVLWAAAFGLIVRMLIEDIPPEQREKLLDEHIKLVTEGLLKGK